MAKEVIDDLFTLAKSIEPHGNARVVSALVYKNRIISYGHNHCKTHPFHFKYSKNLENISFHAETHCIKNALRYISVDDLKKSVLYIVRAKTNKDHSVWTYGLAKPCVGCLRCIQDFGIKKIIYTTDNNTLIEELL